MTAGTFSVATQKTMHLADITEQVREAVAESGVQDGICFLYTPHTTAGLTINEGADPDVRDDIISALRKIVPLAHPYRHREGNSPAHVMASLVGSSVLVFIENSHLRLGVWQKIFFCEFDGPRTRQSFWRIQQ